MFEKFGEFDSCEEINLCAEGLLNEGDLKSLKVMADENGIDTEMTELYINGEIPELCDILTAALGKIDVECRNLKPAELMADWVEYIRGLCAEREEVAAAVRKKGKSLKGCIAKLLLWSFQHQIQIDRDVIKAAGVSAGKVTLGIPGMGRAKQIIREYYLEDSGK